MKIIFAFSAVAPLATFLAWLAIAPEGAAEKSDSARLPGARDVIDAANYASLQEALDALPAEGGVVRIPPGEFEIDRPLVISAGDVSLEGSGGATLIKNTSEGGQPAIVIEHPQVEQNPRQNRLWRVRMANFRLTGNEKSGHGIVARQVNEFHLDGVTISEHGGDGLRLDQCYEDPRVSDSLITYNKGVGLNLLGCHDIVVSGNQFEENGDALHCTDGFNLCMTGNCLDDHLGRGVLIENTYGSVVAGNMIEECAAAAITLDRDCYGITLSANVIAHNGAGIVLVDAHGCSVTGNTFTINTERGLYIGPGSGRIAVTGNSFSDSFLGEGELRRAEDDRAAGGLVLDGASDLAVCGNQFSGLRPAAVSLPGEISRRVVFSGNVLTDAAGDHEKLAEEGLVSGNLEDRP